MKNKFIIIIMFIISIATVSSISIYATYNYFAKDVSYTKPDGTQVSVEEALNDLYNNNYNNITSTVVASGIYGESQNNPFVNLEYTFKEDGYAIVNLGTRSAGSSSGTTSYTIKIDNEVKQTYTQNVWACCQSWSGIVTAGQKISVYVNNTAPNAAAFAFINFVK